MKIAIASDERTTLATTIISDLQDRGHTLTLFGPLSSAEKPEIDWPLTSSSAAELLRAAKQTKVSCSAGRAQAHPSQQTRSLGSVLHCVMMLRRRVERRSGIMRMCWRLVWGVLLRRLRRRFWMRGLRRRFRMMSGMLSRLRGFVN